MAVIYLPKRRSYLHLVKWRGNRGEMAGAVSRGLARRRRLSKPAHGAAGWRGAEEAIACLACQLA